MRVAVTYPVHKYLPDSDSLLSGLTAFKILDGDLVVFFSGVRLGAFESYLHAVSFFVFGRSRTALTIAPLVCGILTVLAFAVLANRLLPRRAAAIATILIAVPPPSFLYWLYMPNGYSATILFCTLSVLLASFLTTAGSPRWIAAAYGVAVGLAWWNSPLSIGVTLPSMVWVGWRHPTVVRQANFWVLCAGGLVLGAAPWVLYNIKDPLASFRGEWGATPAASIDALASNLGYVAVYKIPALLADRHPVDPSVFGERGVGALAALAIAAMYVAGLLIAILLLVWRRRPRVEDAPVRSVLALAVSIIAATVVLNGASQFGSVRGLTVRYVLPMYLGLAIILAVSLGIASAWRRLAGALALVFIVVFNASGYYWPWTEERLIWRRNLSREGQLLAYLKERDVEWVFGDYWSVYPVNFSSGLQILGIPYQRIWDYYNYADRLPARRAKWLLVSWEPLAIEPLVRASGLTGTTTQVAEGLVVFEPREERDLAEPARYTAQRLRQILAPAGE